jgi:hypothetical protein
MVICSGENSTSLAQYQMQVEREKHDWRIRAQSALEEFNETHSLTKTFFLQIREDALNEYSKPRILAMLAEANAVAEIPVIEVQDCVNDYIWIAKTYKRKSVWLQSIVRKCQIVLRAAEEMAAKLNQARYYDSYFLSVEDCDSS